MRIGIVGAENSHTGLIATALNVHQAVPGFAVTHLWGETEQFARQAAETGRIPAIVADPTDMIGEIDAAVFDHRDGKHHLPAARPFVEAGLPVFIDKPFCTDLEQGVEFVRFARAKGVPVTSFSTLPLEHSVAQFADRLARIGRLRSLVTAGPLDVDSPYSGVFFYGIHQVELMLKLVAARPVAVTTARLGHDGAAAVTFEGGPICLINCLQEWWGGGGFHALACGDDGVESAHLTSDEQPLLTGIRTFCAMFETGIEPVPPRRYLTAVAVLAAMRGSFETGQSLPVASVPDL
jgi:predicted dehydrogenase